MRGDLLALRRAARHEAADAQRRALGGEVGLARGVAHVELGAHHALPLGGVLDPGRRLRRLLDAGDVAAGRALQRLHGEHRLGALRGARVVDLLGERRGALQLPEHSHGGQRYGRVPAHVTNPCARPPARARPPRNRCGGAQGARQRGAGAGHRRQARGQADADRQGQDRDAARGQARRRRLPQRQARHATALRGKRVRVLSDRSAPPSKKLYSQKIPKSGYGYLTTRDGTKLAINVHLPSGPGPYPTLVEYSGYGYANPAGAQSGISPIANLLGYAVVDVNMRGTGCSGGAFDFFETLQNLDGYDIIETVARQPWAARGKVGMIGVSYGGISQLFVAQTRPPSLSAIAPLSVLSSTQTTLYPGGILNTGFTLEWAKDRADDAKPASKTGGQPWALKRIQEGDKTCKANQALHAEAIDVIAKVRAQRPLRPEGRRPAGARPLRAEDQRAGLPRLPVHRRADRRALPVAAEALHRHEAQVVHVRQRRPPRLARPGHVRALVRLPRALRRAPPAAAAAGRPRRRAAHPQGAHGRRGRRPARRRPDPGAAELRGGARRVRGAAVGADPVRQRRRLDAVRARPRLRALVLALPAAGHGGALVVPRGRAARWPT